MAAAAAAGPPGAGKPEPGEAAPSPSTSAGASASASERGSREGRAAAAAATAPFLKRKELVFEPNHAATAMLLGDVDGDGEQELVLGGLDGSLAIFKGLERSEPWATASNLGTIRAFALGCIWPRAPPRPAPSPSNNDAAGAAGAGEGDATTDTQSPPEPEPQSQQLVVVTVEGDLHIFDCCSSSDAGLPPVSPTATTAAATTTTPPDERATTTAASPAAAEQAAATTRPRRLRPAATEAIEPNAAAALVVDVDRDGRAELLVGGADGVIHVFGWAVPAGAGGGARDRDEEGGGEEGEDGEGAEAWDGGEGASSPLGVHGTPPQGFGRMASASAEGAGGLAFQQQWRQQRLPPPSSSSLAFSWGMGRSGSFEEGGVEGEGMERPPPQMWEKGRTQASAGLTSLCAVGGGGGGGGDSAAGGSGKSAAGAVPTLPLCVVAGLETGTVEVFCCDKRMEGGTAPIPQEHQQQPQQQPHAQPPSQQHQHFFPPSDPDGAGDGDDPAAAATAPLPGPLSLSLVDLGMGGGLPLPHCGWCGPVVCCPTAAHHDHGRFFAVAGLDGRVGVGTVRAGGGDADAGVEVEWRALWSRQTAHPFFAASRFSLRQPEEGETGGSGGGFAACGWGGVTWIVGDDADDTAADQVSSSSSQQRPVLVFDAGPMLAPPLRGFVAGRFGGGGGTHGSEPEPEPELCLFYSCADGRVRVFHDLRGQLQLAARDGVREGEGGVAARLLGRSEGVMALVRAWCELHMEEGGGGGKGGSGSGGAGGDAPPAVAGTAGGGGGGGAAAAAASAGAAPGAGGGARTRDKAGRAGAGQASSSGSRRRSSGSGSGSGSRGPAAASIGGDAASRVR